jgi:hypothetical protein
MLKLASGGFPVERVLPQSPADGELEPGGVILEVDRAQVATAHHGSRRLDRVHAHVPARQLRDR